MMKSLIYLLSFVVVLVISLPGNANATAYHTDTTYAWSGRDSLAVRLMPVVDVDGRDNNGTSDGTVDEMTEEMQSVKGVTNTALRETERGRFELWIPSFLNKKCGFWKRFCQSFCQRY